MHSHTRTHARTHTRTHAQAGTHTEAHARGPDHTYIQVRCARSRSHTQTHRHTLTQTQCPRPAACLLPGLSPPEATTAAAWVLQSGMTTACEPAVAQQSLLYHPIPTLAYDPNVRDGAGDHAAVDAPHGAVDAYSYISAASRPRTAARLGRACLGCAERIDCKRHRDAGAASPSERARAEGGVYRTGREAGARGHRCGCLLWLRETTMAADGVPMETMWPVALQWLSSVRGVYLLSSCHGGGR